MLHVWKAIPSEWFVNATLLKLTCIWERVESVRIGRNTQQQPNFATGFVLIPKASLWPPKPAVDQKALEMKLVFVNR